MTGLGKLGNLGSLASYTGKLRQEILQAQLEFSQFLYQYRKNDFKQVIRSEQRKTFIVIQSYTILLVLA